MSAEAPYPVSRVTTWLALGLAAASLCQGGSRPGSASERPGAPVESAPAGTTYFVDAESGNDSFSGRLAQPDQNRLDGPRRTIQAGYDALGPGDALSIKKGVYRETVTLYKRASLSSPIVIGPFPGDEGKVVISAAEEIKGWRRCADPESCPGNPNWQHVFYVDVNDDIRQLFQEGRRLKCARYPYESWFYPTSVDASHPNTTFFDSHLGKADGAFAGNTCNVKTAMWHVDHIAVEAYRAQDGRITLVNPTWYEISPDFGYYFTNVVGAIDEPGEWACDTERKRLYLWPASESLERIETSVRRYGIDTHYGCSYHTVEGLAVKYAAEDGIRLYMTDHVTIRNNTIDYSDSAGINVYEGTGARLTGNVVNYSKVRGITDRTPSSAHLVQGNTVYATGAENPGDDAAGDEGQGIFIGGSQSNVINNRVDRSSCTGIYIDGETSGREIAYNYITNACLSLSDGGGIYTGGHSPSSEPDKADRYHHNIVVNVWGYIGGCAAYRDLCSKSPALCRGAGYGIYLDEEGNNRVFEDNTVLSCGGAGIYLHWTRDNRLVRNTACGNAEHQILLAGKNDPRFMLQDNDMQGNLLIAAEPSQMTLQLNTDYNNVHFGDSDGNYFYHPAVARSIGVYRDVAGLGYRACSLGEWQRLSSLDRNSRDLSPAGGATAARDVPTVFTNPSMAAKTFDLEGQSYRDANGDVVEGTITLGPFASRVLFRQGAPDEGGR